MRRLSPNVINTNSSKIRNKTAARIHLSSLSVNERRRLIEEKSNREHALLKEYVREVLQETSVNESAMNVVLDLVGIIPGLGEFADAANAISYAKQGEYLFAALSIISMVPEIGDVIGKGGKLAMWVTKTFPKGANQIAKHGPDVVKGIKSAQSLIKKNKGLIENVFSTLEKNDKFKEIQTHLPKIKGAIDAFLGTDPEKGPEAATSTQK